jgi:MazG family protein
MDKTKLKFEDLIKTVKALRTPITGCPWDLEQDHKSLRPYLTEEAHEVLQAIDQEDDKKLAEELGDLLLQVVLHSQIATDRGSFGIEEVITAIDEKMIRRHPHVFGETKLTSSSEVLKNWEAIKTQEKSEDLNQTNSTTPISNKLDDIPLSLPALIRAQRIGEKVSRSNFDWDSIEGVFLKVKEELEELNQEIEKIKQGNIPKDELKNKIGEELGDLLFSICQLSRWLDVHAEDCLREACLKFQNRFKKMESALGSKIEQISAEELDKHWERAKSS